MTEASKINKKNWNGPERRGTERLHNERRAEIANTVRKTREKLTSHTGHSKDFDLEILTTLAHNFRAVIMVFGFLILMMAIFSLNWLNYFGVLIWTTANLSLQSFIAVQFRHFCKNRKYDVKTISKWRNKFNFLFLMSGLVWASFIFIPVVLPSLSQSVFVFTTLLVAIAIYCFISAPLSMSVLSSTMPVTFALALDFFQSQYSSQVMMAVLFIGAQIVFIFMARQMRINLMAVFTIRAEKDYLILDLEEATAIANEARRRSEEANLAKSRFLATMSHELRTPLNAILGFSEIMKEELLGPLDNKSYKEYINDIHVSGDHLLNLINEILDLSRIEAGRYELNEEAVTLAEVVEDCFSLIEIRAKNKNIAIAIDSETNMPRVWADQRALRQIILNLMSNAVKFTQQGGEINVLVGWTAGGGQYVSIRDNGPGIPEEEIPIVMSQFGQGSIAIKSAEQGTGLGLPICQALINMHGGSFDLKSKLRVGTVVTISIPKNRVMQALAPVEDVENSRDVTPVPAHRIVTKRTA